MADQDESDDALSRIFRLLSAVVALGWIVYFAVQGIRMAVQP